MGKNNPDVIMIGAGIIGSSIALELSKKGFQTLNIEKLHTAGYGSTAGSCGVIRAHYSTEAGVRFAYEGFFYWLDWENHIGTEDDLGLAQYINCGTVLLKTQGHNYEKVLRHYRKVGVEYEEWTNEQLQARIPILIRNPTIPPLGPTTRSSGRSRTGISKVRFSHRNQAIARIPAWPPTMSCGLPRQRERSSFQSGSQ